jgi:predicted CxxxxCH...CXXCH cytochrome family protein
MGKVIMQKMNGLSWWMKTSLVLLLTLASNAFMSGGLLSPGTVHAAITQQAYWTVTSAATAPAAANYTIAAGTNRMLVVGVSVTTTAAVAQTCTATYGGTALTPVPNTATGTTSFQHTYMFYLPENATLMNNTARSLAFTVTGGTVSYSSVYKAVFAGVDQTANPFRNSTNSSVTAVGTPTFATGLVINTGDQAVEIINATRSASVTYRTITTYKTGWAAASSSATATLAVQQGSATNGTSNYLATSTTASASDTSIHTWSGTSLYSISGLVIKAAVTDTAAPTDGTLTATAGNTTNALSWTAATDTGGGTVASYILVYNSGATATAPANCSTGTAVTGSPFASTVLSFSHSALTNNNQYAYRLCATDSFGNTSVGTTITATPTAPLSPSLTACNSCHFNPTAVTANGGSLDGSGRNTPVGLFRGSHDKHVTVNLYNCATCHTTPATETAADFTHADGTVNIKANGSLSGGSYGKASFAPTNTFSPNSCSATTCHGTNSQNWGTTNNDATCVKCHGVAGTTTAAYTLNTAAPGYNGTGVDTAGLAANTASPVGAHDAHLRATTGISSPIACTECHTVPSTVGDQNHIDSALPAEVPMAGTLATTNGAVPAYNSTTKTCSSTYCHFGKPTDSTGAGYTTTNATVTWSNTALLNGTNADCSKCHGTPPTNTGTGATSSSHTGVAYPAGCNKCHNDVSTTTGLLTSVARHMNGVVNVDGGHSFPYPGATHKTATDACSSCHNTTATGVTYATWATNSRGTAPNCTTCHLNGVGGASGSTSCSDCHGLAANNTVAAKAGAPSGTAFPNLDDDHTWHVGTKGYTCSTCHSAGGTGSATHGNSNGVTRTPASITASLVAVAPITFTPTFDAATSRTTCANISCHSVAGAAIWGVTKFDCIGCHSSTILIENGPLAGQAQYRAAVAASLKSSATRSHKGTAIGSDATKWDCVVCHMEGEYATAAQSNVHGNGVLDFRDPDTGVQVKKVEWGGKAYAQNLSDAAGRYKNTLTNFTTARFTRDLSVVLESDPNWLKIASVQMNLCLNCHDYDGATNSNAWTKNSAGTVVGTAGRPFGLAVTSTATQYWVTTTLRSAAGNVTGNVMNVFSQLSTANASAHPVTGRGNNGFATGSMMKAPWGNSTKTITARASNTVYGYLISCFDCHTANSSTGLQTGTDVAHGNNSTTAAVALVKPYPTIQGTAAAPNLCNQCHADGYATGTSAHPSNSASGFSSMNATTMGTCANCHVTTTATVGARAVAVHGYNVTEAGAATFPTTASRPYAFWRGGPSVTYWGPGSCQVSCTTETYTSTGVY